MFPVRSMVLRFVLLLTNLCLSHAQDLFLASSRRYVTKTDSAALPLLSVVHDGRFGQEFTGRLRLHISTTETKEPSELLFGKDVESWAASKAVVFGPNDESIIGFPALSIEAFEEKLRPGEQLYVQAELVRYDLYRRKNLPATWLPTSCVSKAGDNGQYAKPDGTLLSDVVRIELGGSDPVQLRLEKMMPDSTPLSPGCAGLGDGVDSDWIKTVRINSTLLSEFWNRPILLEACVLMPWGYHDHPEAQFPLVVAHGHYSAQFMPGGGFRETEPTCDPRSSYDCYSQHDAFKLFNDWKDPAGPFNGARALVMTINHPVPFFDDSYAVNSANTGPYGDAIVHELIPEVERKFRGLGQGWARSLLGGSTGGWEVVAQQVFYPEDFNGILSACPDPLTFTSYPTTNIYEASNFFFYDDRWSKRSRPSTRDQYSGLAFQVGKGPTFVNSYGQITQTIEEANLAELAQGTKGRSCGQYDAWEATYSPACEDGFPCRLFDKRTGAINRTVAEYWKNNYDLAHILKRDWSHLGPLLRGKLRIVVGASDTFYLNNAVMDLKKVLDELDADAEITFGEHEGIGFQHCFNGYMYDESGKVLPNSVARNHYLQMNLPVFAKRWVSTAPSGADVISWRY